MGYAICKAYYSKADDKKAAIKKIIELNYSDTTAVESFLYASGYYPAPFNKKELLAGFKMKQPHVIRIEPFNTGDSTVDPADTVLTIVFSTPMKKGVYSINFGKGGKGTYPIVKVLGYSEDDRSFRLAIGLKPHSLYEFVLTSISFASDNGYPLIEYPVSFKTK